MADVERQWEAGCVPHGAREVDGSGTDAEGGFRHPQPSAADVERERVTALWREAAAGLDEISAQARAEQPCAECGRLREQLDAARLWLLVARDEISKVAYDKTVVSDAIWSALDALVARAALGVEGEQEKERR